MDVFDGNRGNSKTMTGDPVNCRGDLEHLKSNINSDSVGAKKPNVLGNKSVNHIDTKDDNDDVTQQFSEVPTSHSYHSDDDCFQDNEEELFFPFIKCESQSLLESMAKELELVFDTEHFRKSDLGFCAIETCDKVIMGSNDDKVVLLNEDNQDTETVQYKDDSKVMEGPGKRLVILLLIGE